MIKSITRLIFFGNYFVGILAIALCIESNLQLQLPLNSTLFYIVLFCATIIYYTYAYSGPLRVVNNINARSEWYKKHKNFVIISQTILFFSAVVLSLIFVIKNYDTIFQLPFYGWVGICIMLLAGFFYYGLLPRSFYKIKLRNTGWLKAFVIGFVWACCANLLSLIVLQMEKGMQKIDIHLFLWLFLKNWMFCTVNAIMFDIKDYTDDSNAELKTFVVRFGLRSTIFFILIPLMLVGIFSFVAAAFLRHLSLPTFLFNLTPFVLLLMLAWSMQKPHKIMYYLIVIDGLVLLKALCGIEGSFFMK